jgi:hypothetical protein
VNGGTVEAAEVGMAQPSGQPTPYKYVHSEMERERCGLRLTREEVEAYKGRFPHINERDISSAVDSACYLARPAGEIENGFRLASVEKDLAYRNRERAEAKRREAEAARRKAMEKPTDTIMVVAGTKIDRAKFAEMERAYTNIPNVRAEIYSYEPWLTERAAQNGGDVMGPLLNRLKQADAKYAKEEPEANDHSW